MQPALDPPAPRSLGAWLLLLVALGTTIIGGFILVATALGFGYADVRGVRLEGGFNVLFLGGLAVAVTGAGAAAVGLAHRRPWGRWLLAAVWPSFALVCLILDRIVPASGEGRPLAFYLLGIGLLPAVLTLLLGRTGGPPRRGAPAPLPQHSSSEGR